MLRLSSLTATPWGLVPMLLLLLRAVVGQDVSFLHQATHTISRESAVALRFYLQNATTAEPIPYRDEQAFQLSSSDGIHQFGSSGATDWQIPLRDFGATIYLTLLLDTVASIEHGQLQDVVRDFVNELMTTTSGVRGEVFVKLIAFSGSREVLDLTASCGHEGFCGNAGTLVRIIDHFPAHLNTDRWPSYDPWSSNVYGSIVSTLDNMEVMAQAHADHRLRTTGESPSAMVEYLVVFSDLHETAHHATVDDVVDQLRLAGRSQKVSLVVVDMPPEWYEGSNQVATDRIAADKVKLGREVDQILESEYGDTNKLRRRFLMAANRCDDRANGWYEMRVCPTSRHGYSDLTVETKDFAASASQGRFVPIPGQMTATFSATGFGNTCPYTDRADMLQQTTSFCEGRSCGLSDGVFCGLCEADNEGTTLIPLRHNEAAVLKVRPPPAGSSARKELSLSVLHDGQPVATAPEVTAHVKGHDGVIERVAILPGSTHDGVSVISGQPCVSSIQDCSEAPTRVRVSDSAHEVQEVLLHVSWSTDIPAEAIDQLQVVSVWQDEDGNTVDAPTNTVPPPPPAVFTHAAMDDSCDAFSASGSCVNGHCSLINGRPWCACDAGWTGPRCTTGRPSPPAPPAESANGASRGAASMLPTAALAVFWVLG